MTVKESFTFFYLELKRPDKESKCREKNDFVKLMKQIELNMTNPVSLKTWFYAWNPRPQKRGLLFLLGVKKIK
jgi:hypothetical protein